MSPRGLGAPTLDPLQNGAAPQSSLAHGTAETPHPWHWRKKEKKEKKKLCTKQTRDKSMACHHKSPYFTLKAKLKDGKTFHQE